MSTKQKFESVSITVTPCCTELPYETKEDCICTDVHAAAWCERNCT